MPRRSTGSLFLYLCRWNINGNKLRHERKDRPTGGLSAHKYFLIVFVSHWLSYGNFKKTQVLPSKPLHFHILFVTLPSVRGEIPSHRCISFYFALYRSDLGNRFGIVRMWSKGKTRNGFPANIVAMHMPYGVEHSYMLAGVPIPRSAP
jgi:hypothetical protein